MRLSKRRLIHFRQTHTAELGGSSAGGGLSLIDLDDGAPSNGGSAGGVGVWTTSQVSSVQHFQHQARMHHRQASTPPRDRQSRYIHFITGATAVRVYHVTWHTETWRKCWSVESWISQFFGKEMAMACSVAWV